MDNRKRRILFLVIGIAASVFTGLPFILCLAAGNLANGEETIGALLFFLPFFLVWGAIIGLASSIRRSNGWLVALGAVGSWVTAIWVMYVLVEALNVTSDQGYIFSGIIGILVGTAAGLLPAWIVSGVAEIWRRIHIKAQ